MGILTIPEGEERPGPSGVFGCVFSAQNVCGGGFN